jgi:hypothetical protein
MDPKQEEAGMTDGATTLLEAPMRVALQRTPFLSEEITVVQDGAIGIHAQRFYSGYPTSACLESLAGMEDGGATDCFAQDGEMVIQVPIRFITFLRNEGGPSP